MAALHIYIGNECETYATQFYPDGHPEPESAFAIKSVGQMDSWSFAPMEMWSTYNDNVCGDPQLWIIVSQDGNTIYEGESGNAPLGLYAQAYPDENGVMSGHLVLGEYQ